MKKKTLFLVLFLILALLVVPSVQVMAGTVKVGTIDVSGQTPSPVNPGSKATYSVTIYRSNPKGISTSGSFDVTLSLTGKNNLPEGTITNFNPQTVLFASTDKSKTASLEITVPSTASGTYCFEVKVTRNDAPYDYQFGQSTLVAGKTQYSIVASVGNTGGTVDPLGTTLVDAGSNQAYAISASIGYHISDVLVDSQSVGPVSSYTFAKVQSDHTITAFFTVNIALSLPNGVTAEVGVSSDPPFGLPPLTNLNGGVYFEVTITGILSGNVLVQVQYDPEGLSTEQQQNLRLYMGDPVDLDNDGTVNGNDVTIIQNAVHDRSTNLALYDINHDGKIDKADVAIVQQYSSNGVLVPTPSGGQMRLPWIDITTGIDVTNHIIYGTTSHFSGFGIH